MRNVPAPVWIGGVLALSIVAWAIIRPRRASDTGNIAVDVSRDVAGAISGALSGVIGGVVQGGAAVVGVPMTGAGVCCDAIDAYDRGSSTFEQIRAIFRVSFQCPARDYLKWAAGRGRPEGCPKRGVVTWEMEGGKFLGDER